jgi:hypothetical protein
VRAAVPGTIDIDSDFVTRNVGAALFVQAVIISGLLITALDVYAHKRTDGVAGLNIWGYRGPVTPQKQPNELRILLVGGTRAFGWGQDAFGTSSTLLRRLIMLETDRPGAVLRPITVVNLGRIGASAHSYAGTLDHYAYLDPDLVCIYDDLGMPFDAGERRSGIFALTGYVPALPLVLREKGIRWRVGDVRRGYEPGASPDPATPWWRRTAGGALEFAGQLAQSVDETLASREPSLEPARTPYAQALVAAIDTAESHARGVVVVLSPAETAGQAETRRAVRDVLTPLLESRRTLRVVDLSDVPELTDPALRLDGWNYGAQAITAATTRMTPAVLDLLLEK